MIEINIEKKYFDNNNIVVFKEIWDFSDEIKNMYTIFFYMRLKFKLLRNYYKNYDNII